MLSTCTVDIMRKLVANLTNDGNADVFPLTCDLFRNDMILYRHRMLAASYKIGARRADHQLAWGNTKNCTNPFMRAIRHLLASVQTMNNGPKQTASAVGSGERLAEGHEPPRQQHVSERRATHPEWRVEIGRDESQEAGQHVRRPAPPRSKRHRTCSACSTARATGRIRHPVIGLEQGLHQTDTKEVTDGT